jgi:hypothetical protein
VAAQAPEGSIVIKIFDCDQNSPEWFAARCGVPTASNFSAILAKGEGKTRKSYLNKLAAEIITGEAGESFTSQAMERGREMEAEARDLYDFLSDEPLHPVGFVLNGNKGASPDRFVGKNGGLEIKTQRGDLLVETLLADKFPSEHKAQVQGNLWVTEREWWDLCVYWPKMPLFLKRVTRDEAYIAALAVEVDRFHDELHQTVERIRRFGKTDAVAA